MKVVMGMRITQKNQSHSDITSFPNDLLGIINITQTIYFLLVFL
jgi:hypothetical protein